MKDPKDLGTMNLFDLLNDESLEPKDCKHIEEDKTETQWPGEDFKRLTWTCKECKRVRGRC